MRVRYGFSIIFLLLRFTEHILLCLNRFLRVKQHICEPALILKIGERENVVNTYVCWGHVESCHTEVCDDTTVTATERNKSLTLCELLFRFTKKD